MSQARILYVEDNSELRFLTCQMLDGSGYDVVSAATLEEALQALDNGPFDLVFTDLSLGRLSDEETLKVILKHAAGIPVVVMTGSQGDRQKWLDLGAADHEQKPFTREPEAIAASILSRKNPSA